MPEDATNPAEAPEVDTDLPVDDDGQIDQPELNDLGEPVENPPAAEDDSEEIEHDGQKYLVPKALKDSFLMHADYTRKTQDVAAQRTALEAERTQFQQLSSAEINAHATVLAIDRSLKEYSEIDWRSWFQRDPASAQAAKLDFDELKEQRQQAVGTYQQARNTRTEQEQQDTAKRLQQGQAELARDIPGWGSEKASALLDFGHKHYGFDRAELNAISDPRLIKVLHAAFEHVQSSAKQQTVAKVQAQAAVKPAAKVGGGALPATSKLDDRTSTDAWMKARQQQVVKKR